MAKGYNVEYYVSHTSTLCHHTRVWYLDADKGMVTGHFKYVEKQTNLTLGHVLAPDTDTQI